MKKSARLAAAMLAASGLLLAGCASDPTLDESWPEIRQKVVDAESLRLQVEGTAADQEEEKKDDASASASPSASASDSDFADDIRSANMDLAGATDGSYVKGTVNMDMGAARMDFDVLRRDDEAYVKFKADGDDMPAEMGMFSALVGDRWIKASGDELADLDVSLKEIMSDFEDEMPAADAFDGKDLKAEKVELDGRKYLKYTLPEEQHEFARALLIDPEGKTLYRLEDMNAADDDADVEANATFTEWNAVQAPEVPAKEDVFDLSELQGLTG